MTRDLERRLARAEIVEAETDWADWQRAAHRRNLRVTVKICQIIRDRFLLMGLDPSVAMSLQRGDEAAAELAAVPDSEALRAADEAISRSYLEDSSEAASSVVEKIKRMGARMAAEIREGIQPDLAKASVAELMAFCVAIEKLAWGDEPNPSERIAA